MERKKTQRINLSKLPNPREPCGSLILVYGEAPCDEAGDEAAQPHDGEGDREGGEEVGE